MSFTKLALTFTLMTCIAAQDQYEKYYKVFEEQLIKKYGDESETVKNLMHNLKDEEVILRLSQETLGNSESLIHELSKYLNQPTTPQSEENHLKLISIVAIIFVIIFLIGILYCIFYFISSKSIRRKHENTSPKKESMC